MRMREHEPRSKFATRKPCVACLEQLERGECSGLPATLWSVIHSDMSSLDREVAPPRGVLTTTEMHSLDREVTPPRGTGLTYECGQRFQGGATGTALQRLGSLRPHNRLSNPSYR